MTSTTTTTTQMVIETTTTDPGGIEKTTTTTTTTPEPKMWRPICDCRTQNYNFKPCMGPGNVDAMKRFMPDPKKDECKCGTGDEECTDKEGTQWDKDVRKSLWPQEDD